LGSCYVAQRWVKLLGLGDPPVSVFWVAETSNCVTPH
jgi:hypothetical protein